MGGLVSKVTDAVGLTDSDAGKSEIAAAQKLQKDVLRRLEGVDLPDIEKQRIALRMMSEAGLLEAEDLDETEFADIEEDPRLRAAQMTALEELSERGERGFTPQDIARFEEAQEAVAAQEASNQAAILQGMAQRGTLDSGAQLAAQLASQQGSFGNARQNARDMAAQAAGARQDALARSANLASGMSQQDFNRAAQTASAADRINQFNVQNRQNIAAQNLGIRQQDIGLQNQQQMFNRGLEQQRFQNEMAKAGATGQAISNMAQTQMNLGQAKVQGEADKMGALVGAGATLAASDKNVKKNVSTANSDSIEQKLDELLSELKAYKYDYKDPEKHGKGERVGVMAQDLEKSDLGQEFVEEDVEGTKRVDYGEMAGTQLAGLADLYRRVKKLENE